MPESSTKEVSNVVRQASSQTPNLTEALLRPQLGPAVGSRRQPGAAGGSREPAAAGGSRRQPSQPGAAGGSRGQSGAARSSRCSN